ncbi:Putative ribonuclease H protein At1g65750 [Linum grandiflorum]
MALLAKQVWRLLVNPDSLVARIYKAKYFPATELINANLGHRPSFIWRSLCEARKVIQAGYRWKQGNGQLVNVWSEAWLKDEVNRHIETPVNEAHADLCVSDLINPYTREWRIYILNHLFLARDVTAILSIPVGVATGPDKRIWHYSKDGRFTVKSAYRLYMEKMIDRTTFHRTGEWCRLWELDIPPNIKQFAWRMVTDVLPTRERLQRRGVELIGTYGICGGSYEGADHLFLACSAVQSGWSSVQLDQCIRNLQQIGGNVQDWFWHMIQQMSGAVCSKLITGFWSIWRERNNMIWNAKITPLGVVLQGSLHYLADWRAARARIQPSPPPPSIPPCPKWHPPPPGYLKCNIDVATFAAEHKTGWGMVIRDSQDTILYYRMSHRAGDISAREGEAVALIEALWWVIELELHQVIFEGDSLELQQALERIDDDTTEFGDLVRMSRNLMRCLGGYKYEFVRRVRNQVAHVLARRSIFHTTPSVGHVPPFWIAEEANCICRLAHP